MHVNFRLKEGEDSGLIDHIKTVKKNYNTGNRSEAMRIILKRSIAQEGLKNKIEKIENTQKQVMMHLKDLKKSSQKSNKNLDNLMKGLYNIFNQNQDINIKPNDLNNTFNSNNKDNEKEELEEDSLYEDEEYKGLLNNIKENPSI